MSIGKNKAQSYADVQQDGTDSRALDALVLLKAADRLESIVSQWDSVNSREGLDQLAEALRYNQRLWTIYQSELTSSDNPLPPELRRNLLVLSDYIDRCTMQILAGPDKSKVSTLISINRQLAEGLSTRPEPASDKAVPPQVNDPSQLDLNI
jgi:flagellar biosynthesis activator protein FlaF